jgi:2-dehydro-3-deoxygalactonokinase
MAGSRNGLLEIPYAPCPIGIAGWAARAMRVTVDALQVTLAPGLSCLGERGVHDVMRGEETQIFGAMARHPELAEGRHCIVLPGTHSKWAVLEDGEVTGFRTYLTGELFALLRDQSTLTRANEDDGGREEGFAAGLAQAGESGALTGMLFAARSEQLLAGKTRGWATGYLSGLLIGQEVREAALLAGDGQIAMIGDPGLTALYRQALSLARRESMDIDGNASAIAGLLALRERLEKGRTNGD